MARKKKSGMTRKQKRAWNRAKWREQQSKRSRTSARRSTRSTSKTRSSGKKRRRLSRKEYAARRVQTGRDYVALKSYRASNYGPVPFELQPSWLRAKQSKPFRAKRARWAKARSGG